MYNVRVMRGVAFPDKGDKCNINPKSADMHVYKVYIQRVQNTAQAQQCKGNGVHYIRIPMHALKRIPVEGEGTVIPNFLHAFLK